MLWLSSLGVLSKVVYTSELHILGRGSDRLNEGERQRDEICEDEIGHMLHRIISRAEQKKRTQMQLLRAEETRSGGEAEPKACRN